MDLIYIWNGKKQGIGKLSLAIIGDYWSIFFMPTYANLCQLFMWIYVDLCGFILLSLQCLQYIKKEVKHYEF